MLAIHDNGFDITFLIRCNISFGMLVGPYDLLVLNLLIMEQISSPSTGSMENELG